MSSKIPRKIHQVFLRFKDGKDLKDIDIFMKQKTITDTYCNDNNVDYKLWLEQDCIDLLQRYPQYIDLYNNFRHEIQKVDFIRYLILYDEGGIYIDLDICPINSIDELLKNDIFFVRWNNDKRKLPYNAVLGSIAKHPVYDNILSHLIESYEAKSKQEIYNTWTGRFVFQTTGHFMLNRVLKKYPQVRKLDILKIHDKGGKIVMDKCPVFEDYNASIWYNTGNQLYNK